MLRFIFIYRGSLLFQPVICIRDLSTWLFNLKTVDLVLSHSSENEIWHIKEWSSCPIIGQLFIMALKTGSQVWLCLVHHKFLFFYSLYFPAGQLWDINWSRRNSDSRRSSWKQLLSWCHLNDWSNESESWIQFCHWRHWITDIHIFVFYPSASSWISA